MFKMIVILPFTLFLFACSMLPSESQNYIQVGNWQALGNFEGSEGLPEKSQQKLQALSDEYGSGAVAYEQYQESYLAAVTVYCEPNNARMLGKLGKPYLHVCERFPNGLFFYQDWLSAKGENSSH